MQQTINHHLLNVINCVRLTYQMRSINPLQSLCMLVSEEQCTEFAVFTLILTKVDFFDIFMCTTLNTLKCTHLITFLKGFQTYLNLCCWPKTFFQIFFLLNGVVKVDIVTLYMVRQLHV